MLLYTDLAMAVLFVYCVFTYLALFFLIARGYAQAY